MQSVNWVIGQTLQRSAFAKVRHTPWRSLSPNLAWPYFGELAHLIQEEARRSGYSIMVVETAGTREHEVSVLRDFRTNLIDGLILSPIELDREGLAELALDAPLDCWANESRRRDPPLLNG